MKKSFAIRVTGKVQNVGFRFYTVRKAEEFNISGFVKNEYNGSVYIEAEGEAEALATFIEWCRRGPDWARVDGFEVQEQQVLGYEGFKVR